MRKTEEEIMRDKIHSILSNSGPFTKKNIEETTSLIITSMPTFAQQDKWIKVEDGSKLPEPDPKDPVRSIRCLLTNGKSEMSFGYYNFIRMLWFWENMYMDHITHWQPLPSPPNSTPST